MTNTGWTKVSSFQGFSGSRVRLDDGSSVIEGTLIEHRGESFVVKVLGGELTFYKDCCNLFVFNQDLETTPEDYVRWVNSLKGKYVTQSLAQEIAVRARAVVYKIYP